MNALRRHRWMHAALSALLILAAAAPPLSRMTCLEAGHSQLVLGDLNDCCPEPENAAGATVKAQCCVATTAHASQDAFVPAHPVATVSLDDWALPSPVVVTALTAWGPLWVCGHGPPPLAATERLARLQVLRI
ncbi:MAG: hypothetical protein IPM68_18880 [Flavobacteriales bacterium]|nr:hypothetical protein [Flavobacteriales bacterium]